MRHSDAKSRRVSGALRQRALPIMDTATAVENGFPEVPCRYLFFRTGFNFMALPSLISLKPEAARSHARASWPMVARVRMLIMAGVAGLFPVTYALGVVRLTGLAL